MKRVQETGSVGYSRYSLGPNTKNWRLFFVYTRDPDVYDMMSDLCTLPNIDQEVAELVERRDFNCVDDEKIVKLHRKYF